MKTRRIALLALLVLCIALALSIIPMGVFAADTTETGLTGIELTSSFAGKTLESGKEYYVAPGATVVLKGGTATSGLKVPSNGTVTIHIPENSTLEVYGGNASGTKGAGAGIEVNAGSTLIVTGKGTLKAVGHKY